MCLFGALPHCPPPVGAWEGCSGAGTHPLRPPFQVAFDEKTPQELLQILNDVFVALDPRHNVDLRAEPAGVTAARLVEFLGILKYAFPSSDM
jgi:hypothetical protein